MREHTHTNTHIHTRIGTCAIIKWEAKSSSTKDGETVSGSPACCFRRKQNTLAVLYY